MRVPGCAAHLAQPILKYGQRTRDPGEPLCAHYRDRQQMRDAEPEPSHPLPSLGDSGDD